jgi:type VI secretion system protein ImpC
LVSSHGGEAKFSVERIDAMIQDLDRKLSEQVDEILHNPKFQEIESAWRGLKFLTDRTDFGENILIDLFDATREELTDDFELAPSMRATRFCRMVYEDAYGTFGGVPYAAILGAYTFGPTTPDLELLRQISNVSAQAHAPFIAAAGPEFFQLDSFERLPDRASVSTKVHERWQSFRDSPNANYVGLTLPRFMVRQPYDPRENPVRSFIYHENVASDAEHYLWANAAFAFGTRLTESFAKFRWCPNIIGPRAGGTLERLPIHKFQSERGDMRTQLPTEISITNPRELELSKEGFIPLVAELGTDRACFFSANSVQRPKSFPDTEDGRKAQTNFMLGTQLPYMFLVNRLAHHIHLYQIQELGSSKTGQELQGELDKWVKQYVADQPLVSDETKARKPFRSVQIRVEDMQGEAGAYRVGMRLTPHVKYMRADFTLSLVGRAETRK